MLLILSVLAVLAAAKVTFTWTDDGDSTCGAVYRPSHWSSGNCEQLMTSRVIAVVGLLAIAALAAGLHVWRRRTDSSAKRWDQWWLGALAVTNAGVLVVACGVGWSMVDHDRELDAFQRRLHDLPLPDGARVVDRGADITDGNRLGNVADFFGYEDHCEYRAWMVIETTLGVSGMNQFYEREAIDIGGVSIGAEGPSRIWMDDVRTSAPGWDPRCNRGRGL